MNIPEEWVQRYVDSFLQAAKALQPGAFKDALLLRADHAMDLVEAYRRRDDTPGAPR